MSDAESTNPAHPADHGPESHGTRAPWFKWWLKPKRFVLGLLGLFIAIQLIPVWLMETNPSARGEPAWNNAQTAALVHHACFDCHSNATTWPWYSRVAPISWLTVYDVTSGRNKLNFSEWQTNPGKYLDVAGDAAEQVQSGEMPPSYYTIMHPSAKLNATEQQQLADGLSKSIK